MTIESEIQADTMLAVGSLRGVRIFRNLTGEGWVGKVVKRVEDRVVLANARRVTFGLFPGSPDLIGWKTITITPDMVGQTIAQIVGIEMKGPRTPTQENQKKFLAVMQDAGAAAGVARSPEDALRIVEGSHGR